MTPRPGGPGARALRVGLVCPYALDVPGGVQNQVLGLAAYLRRAGHDVRVLAPGALPRDAYGLEPGRFTSAGAPLAVRYNGSVAPVALGPLAAARSRRWVTTQAVDLLHVHEPLAPSASLHALGAACTPVVATFHTATPRSRALRIAGSALAGALGNTVGIVALLTLQAVGYPLAGLMVLLILAPLSAKLPEHAQPEAETST